MPKNIYPVTVLIVFGLFIANVINQIIIAIN